MNNKKDFRWWTKKDPHEAVWAAYSHIRQNDGARYEDNLRHLRLYGNRDYLGVLPSTFATPLSQDRVTLNVIKSVCDTVAARIAKNRPRPVFLTSGGNYTFRRRAKLLEKFVDSQFYTSGLNQVAPRVFLDACVFGTGIMKIYRVGTTVKVERVFPGEVFVDQAEGMYGEPQQMYQRKYINRDVLLEMFPGKRELIMRANTPTDDRFNLERDSTVDQVEVVEAWHLPSSPDANDGKHCIVVDQGTLAEAEWNHDYFPFTIIRWSERLRGYWGMGLAEELTGIQIEINKLLMKIQKAFQLLAVPWVLVEAGSKIKKAHLNNQIGAIIPYTGTPPIVRPNQTMSPEVFSHLDRLYQRAYEIAGVSQLSASSLKPAGLESGVALREYNDIESERFALVSRSYEQMFMEAAKQVVNIGKAISEDNPGWSVVTQRDKYTIQEVKWKDVDLEKDAYVLKVFPSSSLPSTPAGRLAMVEQLMGSGLLSPEEAKRLLDFPDLDRELALDRAASDNIDRIIEHMIDDGIFEAPEPFMDLALSLKKTQAAYNKAVNDNVPEDRLTLLRQFMASVHQMIKRAQLEAANATAAPVPGAPPAPGPNGAPVTAVSPEDGNVAFA
jgi:hypothetical protein